MCSKKEREVPQRDRDTDRDRERRDNRRGDDHKDDRKEERRDSHRKDDVNPTKVLRLVWCAIVTSSLAVCINRLQYR